MVTYTQKVKNIATSTTFCILDWSFPSSYPQQERQQCELLGEEPPFMKINELFSNFVKSRTVVVSRECNIHYGDCSQRRERETKLGDRRLRLPCGCVCLGSSGGGEKKELSMFPVQFPSGRPQSRGPTEFGPSNNLQVPKKDEGGS